MTRTNADLAAQVEFLQGLLAESLLGSCRAYSLIGSEGDHVSKVLGTTKWCVAQRMTESLWARGYEVAVSQKRYAELRRAFILNEVRKLRPAADVIALAA